MSAELLADCNGAQVYHADWRSLLPVVEAAGGCDALIVDAPYSKRTHGGHNLDEDSADGMVGRGYSSNALRRGVNYSSWSPADVRAFVEAWAPLCRGWMVSITDHVLARAWDAELERVGRYVFAWLPFVALGSRCRMAGDGPSCWTTQIVVARPRAREFSTWGTLPGAYVLPPGEGGAMPVVGGKPRWLMERLVEDYSRPGALVVDPCCGAGTTAAAAIRTGRRAIVGDMNREHAEMAARWVRDPGPKCPTASEARQGLLFGGAA